MDHVDMNRSFRATAGNPVSGESRTWGLTPSEYAQKRQEQRTSEPANL